MEHISNQHSKADGQRSRSFMAACQSVQLGLTTEGNYTVHSNLVHRLSIASVTHIN